MASPEDILHWIEGHVKPMRRSRQKTLACIVAAAMSMTGTGVLALGRALPKKTTAKHGIKRVWRFFRNSKVEVESVQLSFGPSAGVPKRPGYHTGGLDRVRRL